MAVGILAGRVKAYKNHQQRVFDLSFHPLRFSHAGGQPLTEVYHLTHALGITRSVVEGRANPTSENRRLILSGGVPSIMVRLREVQPHRIRL